MMNDETRKQNLFYALHVPALVILFLGVVAFSLCKVISPHIGLGIQFIYILYLGALFGFVCGVVTGIISMASNFLIEEKYNWVFISWIFSMVILFFPMQIGMGSSLLLGIATFLSSLFCTKIGEMIFGRFFIQVSEKQEIIEEIVSKVISD